MPELRLDDFLADLASKYDVRKAFLKDPEAAMGGAQLSDDERGVLGTGDLEMILWYLQGAGPRPTTPDRQPSTDTGGGSDSGSGQGTGT